MPIYAYKCESCAHAKDVLQKISDPLLTVCPACGAATFKKQLTAAGFQLKGSGWYVTDFKGGGTNKPGESDSAKSDGKSDSKTASGSDASAAAASSGASSTDGGKASASTSAAPAPSAPAATTPAAPKAATPSSGA